MGIEPLIHPLSISYACQQTSQQIYQYYATRLFSNKPNIFEQTLVTVVQAKLDPAAPE